MEGRAGAQPGPRPAQARPAPTVPIVLSVAGSQSAHTRWLETTVVYPAHESVPGAGLRVGWRLVSAPRGTAGQPARGALPRGGAVPWGWLWAWLSGPGFHRILVPGRWPRGRARWQAYRAGSPPPLGVTERHGPMRRHHRLCRQGLGKAQGWDRRPPRPGTWDGKVVM